MAKETPEEEKDAEEVAVNPLEARAGPHALQPGASTQRMMLDVLIGLLPALCGALWFFREAAAIEIGVCVVTALATEWILCRVRGRPSTLWDGSVLITALILAFSLPPKFPVYGMVIGTFMAVALGKVAFGGLGYNIFNPAMVGRAFLMLCFPAAMNSWVAPVTSDALTGATPLADAKFSHVITALGPLVTGDIPGSLGETSAALLLLGGLWVLARRAADWRLTVGMLLGISVLAGFDQFLRPDESLGVIRNLCAGGALLGAFFIVTDPVTSPLTKRGRWAFGILVGVLTMVIRLFAGYPEGVMFAVLLANSVSPLLDRWTAPVPVGGKTRAA
jgi:electron transport complex protein RnfD